MRELPKIGLEAILRGWVKRIFFRGKFK